MEAYKRQLHATRHQRVASTTMLFIVSLVVLGVVSTMATIGTV